MSKRFSEVGLLSPRWVSRDTQLPGGLWSRSHGFGAVYPAPPRLPVGLVQASLQRLLISLQSKGAGAKNPNASFCSLPPIIIPPPPTSRVLPRGLAFCPLKHYRLRIARGEGLGARSWLLQTAQFRVRGRRTGVQSL